MVEISLYLEFGGILIDLGFLNVVLLGVGYHQINIALELSNCHILLLIDLGLLDKMNGGFKQIK